VIKTVIKESNSANVSGVNLINKKKPEIQLIPTVTIETGAAK